ncbi:hypothetical protein BH23CHL2_BH23CHL2_09290 [soil metagenome]
MAISTKHALSADEFWELPEKQGVRFELVDGEVVEMPGSTMSHSEFVVIIFTLLRSYVLKHDLGRVYPDGLSYLLRRNPDTLRIPDVSFIPRDRLPAEGPQESYADIIPGLVVEVVSPGNSAVELRRRTRDYVDSGVEQVWIVWPDDRSVSVYAGSMTPLELAAEDTLDGGDVLPGFSVPVADLFDIEW